AATARRIASACNGKIRSMTRRPAAVRATRTTRRSREECRRRTRPRVTSLSTTYVVLEDSTRMRRCTSHTASSPLWYRTSSTPNSVVPNPKRAMLERGGQKAFGWFGGPGFEGATGFIASMGFRPARAWAVLAVGGELVAGVLFVLGLLTPLAGLLVLATMAVAIAKVHGPKGFFVQNGGFEYNLVLIIAAVAVAAVGPGAFSLDHLLGLAR